MESQFNKQGLTADCAWQDCCEEAGAMGQPSCSASLHTRFALPVAGLWSRRLQFVLSLLQGLCHIVYGGGGIIAGLLPLFVADLALNFEKVPFPCLKGAVAVAALAAYATAAILQGLPERLMLVGGGLAALLPGLTLLPSLRTERLEWWLPFAALAATAALLIGLPLHVYLVALPEVKCPA